MTVERHGGRWQVRRKVDGRRVTVGTYATREEAEAANAGREPPPKRPAEFEVESMPPEVIDVAELVARRKREFERKRAHEEASKLIGVKVNVDGPFAILHLGDPHVDDDGTDIAALERHTDIARNTPGMFVGNVGDSSNNWVGRLARLYAEQSTSAAEAWRLTEWLIGRCRWLYIVNGNHDCHDENTEALTRRGWMRVDDILPTDEVLGLNADGLSEWQPIQAIVRKESDHINEVAEQNISLACTDGHRVLHSDKFDKRLRYLTFAELPQSHIRIPTAAPSGAPDFYGLSDDEIRLGAWLTSDAHISKRDGVVSRAEIYQSEGKVATVRDLLVRLGVEFVEAVRHRDIQEICGKKLHSTQPEHTLRLNCEAARHWTSRLGIDKMNSPDWLHKLSDRQFAVYLESKVDADGTRYGAKTTAVCVYDDRATLDVLQALCIQHGYRASLYQDTRAPNEGWRLSICRQLTTVRFARKDSKRTEGRFRVWCLTVPLSNFMVRRNGRCHFSGNCWSGAGNPLQWIAKQSAALNKETNVRIGLHPPRGSEVRVNVRHDFAGHSQYNPAHGSMKAALFGVKDHILVSGHTHCSGLGVIKDPQSGIVSHCVQVASYKIFDRYARERGFRDQHISPCAVTVIDPEASEASKVQVYWDPEPAAEYLTWLRHRRGAA